jgi:hypothetical protein
MDACFTRRMSGVRVPYSPSNYNVTGTLLNYPSLRAEDLVNAWSYARSHCDKIREENRQNEVAYAFRIDDAVAAEGAPGRWPVRVNQPAS